MPACPRPTPLPAPLPPDRARLPAALGQRLREGRESPATLGPALRAAGPVLWWETGFGSGCWVLAGHAEVEAGLRDPRLSVARVAGWSHQAEALAPRPGDGGAPDSARSAFQRLLARALLFVDDPDHRRLRPLMQAGFGPAALQAERPAIAARCQALLEAVAGQPVFDAIPALARPLPAGVIGRMLGVPDAAQARFAGGAQDLAGLLAALAPEPRTVRRARRRLASLAGLFRQLIEARRSRGPVGAGAAPDLLDRLLAAEAAGQLPHADELLAQAVMLFFAGHETTRHLLGSLLHTVLAQPGLWAALAAEPARIPRVVREVLRLHSPVQYTLRRVARPHTLQGQALARGELVMLMIGAANRDPARHAAPDAFDPERAQPGALAFGSGPHVCLGAALTQLEAELLLQALLQRWPRLRLAQAEPDWLISPLYRGLRSLPLHTGD